MNEIKNAHNSYITNFRYFFDYLCIRDLILSISTDNNLKLWDINLLECLLNLENIYTEGDILSACFLNNNNSIFIATSNSIYGGMMPIKIFNFQGTKIKEINGSKDNTVFIDSYYDKNFAQNYLITGNQGSVKSYDYENNKLYFKYFDGKYPESYHYSIVINEIKNGIILIESSENGTLRLWNFHTGELLKILLINICEIYCLCLWDKNRIFIGGGDGKIKLVDLKLNAMLNEYKRKHNDSVLTIKTIVHPKFGECFISFSREETISLWEIKKFEINQ